MGLQVCPTHEDANFKPPEICSLSRMDLTSWYVDPRPGSTVDGGNLAPPRGLKLLYFLGLYGLKVVQDFIHQQ